MNADGTVNHADTSWAVGSYIDWRAEHRGLSSNPESRHVFCSGYYAALRDVINQNIPLEMLPGIGYFKPEHIITAKPMGGD